MNSVNFSVLSKSKHLPENAAIKTENTFDVARDIRFELREIGQIRRL